MQESSGGGVTGAPQARPLCPAPPRQGAKLGFSAVVFG